MKKKLLLLTRILITLILICILWFFLKDNSKDLLKTLKSANIGLLLFGFGLFALNILALSYRLIYVLKTQNIKLNVSESIIINFIGFFFNSFLPTAVGGDIARGYYLAEKNKEKKIESFTAIIADRTIGLISITFIAIIALFFIKTNLITLQTRLAIIAFFSLTILFVIFSINERLASKLGFLIKTVRFFKIEPAAKRIYKVLNDFRHFKQESLIVFVIAFLGQLLVITVAFIIAKGLNIDLPYSIFLIFMPIVGAASMIPSLGGTGPREGAFILLFSKLTSDAQAGALALMWLTYFISLSMAGGLVYLLSGYHKLSISEIEKAEKDAERNYE